MSKSLYQYKINPAMAQQVESLVIQAIQTEGYVPSKNQPGTWDKGNRLTTGVKRIEFAIIDDTLNICAFKPIYLGLFNKEIGYASASNFYNGLSNSDLKGSVDRIAQNVSRVCELSPLMICQTVDDNHLSILAATSNFSAITNTASVKQETTTPFCSNCGRKINSGERFCPGCGKSLN